MKLRRKAAKQLVIAGNSGSVQHSTFPHSEQFSPTEEAPQSRHEQFEYTHGLPSQANDLGKQGWRLVALDRSEYGNVQLWFVRRLRGSNGG